MILYDSQVHVFVQMPTSKTGSEMKSFRRATLLKLAVLLANDASTSLMAFSYTFDPLNNSWKPSARQKHRRSYESSTPSSYSYAPTPPEPPPGTGVQFTYDEKDIVRHHYTAFIGGDGNNDPAFVPKTTLVEIEYNKKTGEVSLLDEEGVVTPEEYKRIVKAVKYEHEDTTGGAPVEPELISEDDREDIIVGTTMYLDPEDLDLSDVIDTEVEDLSGSAPRPKKVVDIPHYEQKLKDFPQQQLQDHESSSRQNTQSTPATVDSTETFNSYSIPQPSTVNHSVNQYQTAPVATTYRNAQSQQQYEYDYSQQGLQTATAVAQPTTDQYYYQQQQHTDYNYGYEQYYETSVTEQPSNDEGVEETYYDDGTYRKSSGFGFAHRRESFTDSAYEY